ncbi:hypothetical protein WN943_019526 [Citrus x changshan-huyou]
MASFMELKEGVKKAFYKDMAEKIWLRFVVILDVVILSEGRSKVEILLEPMLWLCCIIAEKLQACVAVFSLVFGM